MEKPGIKAQDKRLGASAARSADKQGWQGERRSSFLPSSGSRANRKTVVVSLLTCSAFPGLLRRVGLDHCQPPKAAGRVA